MSTGNKTKFSEFIDRMNEQKTNLLNFLRDAKLARKKVFGYGASTKGNVMLQFCGFSPADLPAIAEINPEKFGSFTPGTHIPIVSEPDARAMAPDYFLVLPWHFKSGIVRREKEFLQRGGKLIFPFPEIEII